MSVAEKTMTLQDYLKYSDDTDNRYELVDGRLSIMPPESRLNHQITSFLFAYFLKMGIHHDRLSIGVQIAVSGAKATARQPDLVVLSEAAVAELNGATQSVITHDMSPPSLVVEIVSPGQEARDYRHKRTEYAGRRIPNYWIVDPIMQKITVLEWVNGLYEEKVFQQEQRIVSSQLSDLELTAAEILNAGR
jgi:Uma2 family endonuclease